MSAVAPLQSSPGVTWQDVRTLIGAEVAAETAFGALHGTLLSCTSRSAWLVVDDVDHVVALGHLHAIRRR